MLTNEKIIQEIIHGADLFTDNVEITDFNKQKSLIKFDNDNIYHNVSKQKIDYYYKHDNLFYKLPIDSFIDVYSHLYWNNGFNPNYNNQNIGGTAKFV